jgi:hypothetical protein
VSRRGPWWPLLLGYAGLLWALVLGICALTAVLPDNWSYSGDDVPLVAIVQSAIWTVAPAVGTAAFAMTATALAVGLVRAGGGSARREGSGDGEDGDEAYGDAAYGVGEYGVAAYGFGEDGVALGEGVLVESLPARGSGRRRT